MRTGHIEVITGPMFSGKTEEMIRRVRHYELAQKNIIVLKPIIGDRFSDVDVVSSSNSKAKTYKITSSREILKYVKEDTDLVVIDEVQFLDNDVPQILNEVADRGVAVIASGLDQDFRGRPFECVANLLSLADEITKLTAVCVVCGCKATKTQRIINGRPASLRDPIVLEQCMSEKYEPRCRKCHEVLR